jgi:hypothetical protein
MKLYKVKVEDAGVRRLELQQAPLQTKGATSGSRYGGILSLGAVPCFDILCAAAHNFN